MNNNKIKEIQGIDESTFFRQLWNRKVWIIAFTVLCGVIGVVHVYLRPKAYSVEVGLKFKKADEAYMKSLLQYGRIDFSKYEKTGKIDTQDSLQLSKQDSILLDGLKNQIELGVHLVDGRIVTFDRHTTDTMQSIEQLTEVTNVLKPYFTSLAKAYAKATVDSLRQVEREINTELTDSIRGLIIFRNEHQRSGSLDAQVQIAYREYVCEQMALETLSTISDFNTYEKLLKKIDIQPYKPKVLRIESGVDNRMLLIRWVVFGFIGGCVVVLGMDKVLALLKKRRG